MEHITEQQKLFSENAKKEGFFILKSIDKRKKQKMYQLVKDINENTKEIKFEMNKAAYLLLKNVFCFEVKNQEASFLNFVPFAERNKDKEPLQEIKY